MCSTLGGRAAEELFLGRISTGAANDLERVTKQAYAMVVYYGMSDKLPNLCYYDSTGQDYGFSKPYSDERAKLIDEEVSRIINEQYERAKAILREHAEGHAKLAETLITREVIFTEDVEQIFGKRQWTSRTDEILAAKQISEKSESSATTANDSDASTAEEKGSPTGSDASQSENAKEENKPDVPAIPDIPQTPPPFNGLPDDDK